MTVTGWLPRCYTTTKDLIQLRFTTEKKDHSSNWKTVSGAMGGQLEQRYHQPDIRPSNRKESLRKISTLDWNG